MRMRNHGGEIQTEYRVDYMIRFFECTVEIVSEWDREIAELG